MREKVRMSLPAVILTLACVVACKTDSQEKSGYIPGGRNIEAYRYSHSEGYPSFSDKAKFVGTLSGSWFEMGQQFGERSGEMTLYVSDIW